MVDKEISKAIITKKIRRYKTKLWKNVYPGISKLIHQIYHLRVSDDTSYFKQNFDMLGLTNRRLILNIDIHSISISEI